MPNGLTLHIQIALTCSDKPWPPNHSLYGHLLHMALFNRILFVSGSHRNILIVAVYFELLQAEDDTLSQVSSGLCFPLDLY